MRKLTLYFAAFALLLGLPAYATGEIPWCYGYTPVLSGTNYIGEMGAKITIGSIPVVVTQLGRYVSQTNTQSHTITLYTLSNTALGSATVTTLGKPAGTFTYASLSSPITLAANTSYYLNSTEAVGDIWGGGGSPVVHTSVATVVGYDINGNATRNQGTGQSGGGGEGSVADQEYVGVSFVYQSLGNIPVTDANLQFPANWNVYSLNGTVVAESTNFGAQFKGGISGTTNIVLNLDPAPLATPQYFYPILDYSIDGGAMQSIVLDNGARAYMLATGVSTGPHTVYAVIRTLYIGDDRWNSPHAIRILGLAGDVGMTSVNPNTIMPGFVQTGDLLVYGDSTAEGYAADGPAPAQSNGRESWVNWVAASLHLEPASRCFGGSSLSLPGTGNVPPCFTPGNDAQSYWNKYDASHSMLSAGVFTKMPSAIIFAHGYNDASNAAAYQTNLTAFLPVLRAAAPNVPIYVVAPFCTGSTMVAIRASMQAAIAATNVSRVYYIDAGLAGGIGIIAGATDQVGTVNSWDRVHPKATLHALFGALVSTAMRGTTMTPPLALTVTLNGSNQRLLTWTADPLATKYNIYRRVTGTNPTLLIGTVMAPTVTFTDTSAVPTIDYTYLPGAVH